MSLVNRMKADRVVARVDNKGDFALLTNVLGDYDVARTQKTNLNKSEEDVLIAVVKVHINRANEELQSLKTVDASVHRVDRARRDVEVLERYLPEMLDEEDLRNIAEQLAVDGKKMPDMMKHLKAEYTNRYDGKLASAIAKEILG